MYVCMNECILYVWNGCLHSYHQIFLIISHYSVMWCQSGYTHVWKYTCVFTVGNAGGYVCINICFMSLLKRNMTLMHRPIMWNVPHIHTQPYAPIFAQEVQLHAEDLHGNNFLIHTFIYRTYNTLPRLAWLNIHSCKHNVCTFVCVFLRTWIACSIHMCTCG